MAEVIVKQQGCVANRIAYPRAVDAFHQALQMLSERSPSPAGPGFSLDLAGRQRHGSGADWHHCPADR